MSSYIVQVTDETTSGEVLQQLELQMHAETVTVAELITARVHQEVRAFNADRALTRFHGLVAPAPRERALNGSRTPRLIDAQEQTKVALRSYDRGHVLLLVDDRQVERIDETVQLTSSSTVTFLKLIPLVGG